MHFFYRCWPQVGQLKSRRLRSSIFLLLMAIGHASHANPVSRPFTARTDELQRRQEQELDQLQERAIQHPDVLSAPSDDKTSSDVWDFPKETVCFVVREVRWDGGNPPSSIQNQARAVLGKCVGNRTLRVLQEQLAVRLVDLGLMTTRVLVPDQSLAQGTLSLRYVPGRIAAVQDADTPGWWRMVVPASQGDILNQRDLDQTLENIRRLKGQMDARIDVVPGVEPGSSDVLMQPGSGKRWHAYIGGDNAGMRSMGRERMNAGLTLDSPLFLYDQLSVSWNSNAVWRNRDNRTRAAAVNYSVPLGYWSVFAGVGRSRYQQTVAGFSEPIVYGGATGQIETGVSVVPYRGSQSKGTVVMKMLRKRVSGTLNDIDLDIQRRDVTGYELGYQHRHYVGRAVLDAGGGVRGTIPRYSRQPGYVYGDPEWNGRTTILAANAGVYLPFVVARQHMAYQFNWQIQHAKTPIVPSDYFTVGDRYTVRGFDGQMTLAAENGWALRNDLSLNLGNLGQQLYAGLDVGQVGGPSVQYLPGRTLAGVAAGLRGRVSVPYVDASYDVSMGWPLKKPQFFPTPSAVFSAALLFEF